MRSNGQLDGSAIGSNPRQARGHHAARYSGPLRNLAAVTGV